MEIEDIIEQADIVEYISQYVDLTEHNGEMWGLSPFQLEKTPSFSVNPEKHVWKDFSSGKGGNIISFIKQYHHCNFNEALRILMKWMDIPDGEVRLKSELARFMKHYSAKDKGDNQATRKILPESVLNTYQKAPITLWNQEGIQQSICEEFEIRIDPYEDAIVIPIRDAEGNLVNLAIRTMDPNYKLLGIPKYIYRYPLGKLDFFYSWHKSLPKIQKCNEVIIVEGAKSVMKLYQYGYPNAVAALTSHITQGQFETLIKQGVDVVFAFDKDASPYKDDLIRQLCRFCKVYFTLDRDGLLEEKDSPVDQGKDVWERLYSQRIRLR